METCEKCKYFRPKSTRETAKVVMSSKWGTCTNPRVSTGLSANGESPRCGWFDRKEAG